MASAAFLVVWWFTLGPVTLGGPATFVVVDGPSMEPTYVVGDLVVARARAEYSAGDIAVFYAPDRRRYVIHRLDEQLESGAWATIGDNNDRRDSWTVPDGAILGAEWFVVPRMGTVLFWVQDHPVRFGGGVAALVIGMSIFGRRRRLHPDLAAALDVSQRASWRAGRPIGDLALLGAAVVSFAISAVVLQSLMAARMIASPPGAIMLGVAGVSLAVGIFLYFRLVLGFGVPEPLASRYVLAGTVWDCPALPDATDTVDHPGARSLRRFADGHTGRVLRLVEHDGADDDVMRETYFTLDLTGTGHRWTVEHDDDAELSRPLVATVPLAASQAGANMTAAETAAGTVTAAGASLTASGRPSSTLLFPPTDPSSVVIASTPTTDVPSTTDASGPDPQPGQDPQPGPQPLLFGGPRDRDHDRELDRELELDDELDLASYLDLDDDPAPPPRPTEELDLSDMAAQTAQPSAHQTAQPSAHQTAQPSAHQPAPQVAPQVMQREDIDRRFLQILGRIDGLRDELLALAAVDGTQVAAQQVRADLPTPQPPQQPVPAHGDTFDDILAHLDGMQAGLKG